MASSSSFINNRQITKDSVCFADIKREQDNKTYVIIEESKFKFPMPIILGYLDDIQGMDFNFTYKYQERKGRILIDVSKVKGIGKRMILFTIIRFLWEGEYGNEYDRMADNFTQVIHHYVKFKTLLPKEKNNLTLLCLATNAFIKGNKGFNAHHFLTKEGHACKLRKKLDNMTDESSVHSEFSDNSYSLPYVSELKQAKSWKKKNYLNLMKELKY